MRVVNSRIVIDIAAPTEELLVRQARRVFRSFDAYASEHLPFDDYDLRIVLEEGSLKGRATVWVTIGLFLNAIGNYGDIIQGVQTIAKQAKDVAEYFHGTTEAEVSASKAVTTMKSSSAGDLDILKGILTKVQQRQLTKEEGLELALDLFSKSGQLSLEVEAYIRTAFESIRQINEQGSLELDVPASEKQEAPVPPRPSREATIPLQSELVVEIRRRSKASKERVRKKQRRK